MICWLSSSQIIIVHTGQVVMDQGHGMNHFQGNGGREGHLFGLFFGRRKHFGSRQTQDRSNALASGHEGVLHGLADEVRVGRVDALDGLFEHFVDGWLLAHDVFAQVKGSGGFGRALLKRQRVDWALSSRTKGGGGGGRRQGDGHKGCERGAGKFHRFLVCR